MGAEYSNKKTGDEGEGRAAAYLAESGFTVVDRNYRIRGGEIDIVATKGEVLVFVEVKTLPNGSPEMLSDELGKRKISKVIRAAKFYLMAHPEYGGKLVRFDIVALDVPGLPPVHHIEDAFCEV